MQSAVHVELAVVVGFEPTNDGVKVRCLYHLATPQRWSRVGDLNSQLTAYKAVTLPIELTRLTVYLKVDTTAIFFFDRRIICS